jgi:hypothetical protein
VNKALRDTPMITCAITDFYGRDRTDGSFPLFTISIRLRWIFVRGF